MEPNLQALNDIIEKLKPICWDTQIFICSSTSSIRFQPEYDDDFCLLQQHGLTHTRKPYNELLLAYAPES